MQKHVQQMRDLGSMASVLQMGQFMFHRVVSISWINAFVNVLNSDAMLSLFLERKPNAFIAANICSSDSYSALNSCSPHVMLIVRNIWSSPFTVTVFFDHLVYDAPFIALANVIL